MKNIDELVDYVIEKASTGEKIIVSHLPDQERMLKVYRIFREMQSDMRRLKK